MLVPCEWAREQGSYREPDTQIADLPIGWTDVQEAGTSDSPDDLMCELHAVAIQDRIPAVEGAAAGLSRGS
jgi:hypothetical protein